MKTPKQYRHIYSQYVGWLRFKRKNVKFRPAPERDQWLLVGGDFKIPEKITLALMFGCYSYKIAIRAAYNGILSQQAADMVIMNLNHSEAVCAVIACKRLYDYRMNQILLCDYNQMKRWSTYKFFKNASKNHIMFEHYMKNQVMNNLTSLSTNDVMTTDVQLKVIDVCENLYNNNINNKDIISDIESIMVHMRYINSEEYIKPIIGLIVEKLEKYQARSKELYEQVKIKN